MAEVDGHTVQDGLRVKQFRCINRLGPLKRIAPRQLATGMWRSDIPAYIKAVLPDVVHLHNPMPPLALRDVARACRRLDVPYVISSHGFVEMTGYADAFHVGRARRMALGPLVTAPFQEAVRHANAVCMLSPNEQTMMHSLGVRDERLAVVTNGSTPYFSEQASDEDRARVAGRFGLSNDRPHLLFVGNHTRNKGIDVLLAALHRVRTPVRLVVAGAIRSRAEHEALCRACAVDALGDRVVFTDHITESELRALYQSVDAFVFPSRADTLPLVVIEAMLSGLPVISTQVGGIPYQVTPETGVLVPPGDPDALSEAISAIISDATRRGTMGEAGRVRAQALFSWDRASDAALEVYRRVSGKGQYQASWEHDASTL